MKEKITFVANLIESSCARIFQEPVTKESYSVLVKGSAGMDVSLLWHWMQNNQFQM